MFKNCTSLKGAITYDSTKLDITYANPNTGYFSIPVKAAYIGILENETASLTDSVAHAVKKIYLGNINNIATKIKKAYIGDENNIARLWWDSKRFPEEPSSYTLIGKYTTTQNWIAPEDGWYKIEGFGASGDGSKAVLTVNHGSSGVSALRYVFYWKAGSGGGGGSYSSTEKIKMNAGDTITLTFNSTTATAKFKLAPEEEVYSIITLTKAGNGTSGSSPTTTSGFAGGAGGTASGGDINISGEVGSYISKYSNRTISTADYENGERIDEVSSSGAAGGAAGYTGGNTGGAGGKVSYAEAYSGESGKPAFFKIYRGNTNLS